jgi:hypothetical protein
MLIAIIHYNDFTAQALVQIFYCYVRKLEYNGALSYLYGLPWVCGTVRSATNTTTHKATIALVFILSDVW